MLNSQRIQDIVNKIFDNFNQILVANKLKKRGVYLGFKGNISVDNTIISFTIGFDENFPLSKPLFFIEQYDSLGFIPHVERDGFICYVQDQNLILDFENPEGIVWECYQKVIRTLEDGKTGKNAIDFLIEFEDYWNRCKR